MIGANYNKHLFLFMTRLVPVLLFTMSCVSGDRHDSQGRPAENTSFLSGEITGLSGTEMKELKGTVISRDTMPLPVKIRAGEPRTVRFNDFTKDINLPKDGSVYMHSDLPSTQRLFGSPEEYPAGTEDCMFLYPEAEKTLPPGMKYGVNGYTKHYSKEQGFGGARMYDLVQDKNNYIWAISHGLIKFDGLHTWNFTHIVNGDKKTHLGLNDILVAASGDIWFIRGSHLIPTNRIMKYDGDSVKVISATDTLGNQLCWRYTCLYEDVSGNMWIGTMFNGLLKYEPPNASTNKGKFIHFTGESGLPGNMVTCITGDENGNLMIGTRDAGLCGYINGSAGNQADRFVRYSFDNSAESLHITSVLLARDGKLWAGTYNDGVYVLDDEVCYRLSVKDGLTHNTVNCLYEDTRHTIWIGTHGGGVCRFDEYPGHSYSGKLTALTTDNLLFSNYILSVLEDSQGRMWFGTFGGTVTMFDPGSFHHINTASGMEIEFVSSPVEDNDGNIWFGDDRGGGICKFDGKNFHYYTRKQGLPSDSIACLMVDAGNNIWIGTPGNGLCKFDHEYFTHHTTANGLKSNKISCLMEDSEGNIWIGSEDAGVSVLKPGRIVGYAKSGGLCDDFIYCLYEDKSKNIWIGTENGGVDRLDGKYVVNYNKQNGLEHNQVVSVLEDRLGNMWFGVSFRGFVRYDPDAADTSKRFILLVPNQGISGYWRENRYHILNGPGVSFMQEDNHGRLWCANTGGLHMIIQPDDNNPYDMMVRDFTMQDGKAGDNSVYNSPLVTKDNRFYWGEGNSIAYIDLDAFRDPADIPDIRITGLELEQTHVDFRKLREMIAEGRDIRIGANSDISLSNVKFDNCKPQSNLPSNLRLPYYLDLITFHFSAVDWQAPHKLLFQYKLEGSDKDWRKITREARVIYSNLSFGKYTFKVKAMGASGIWSREAEFSFRIRPPWWHSWWAYALYVLFFMIVVVYWRVYDLKRQKLKQALEIEKVQAEKLIEIDKMKSRFFANISHEFRTPLTLILGPLKNLIVKEDDNDSRHQMFIMQRNAKRLQRMINQLLSFATLEAGKMKLEARNSDIVSLIRLYVQSFESYAIQREIELSFVSSASVTMAYVDREKIEKILNNLLSNAFKFTPTGGKIEVEVSKRLYNDVAVVKGKDNSVVTEMVEIKVSDTGPGISPGHLNHIFDRFYQTDNSNYTEQEGTGIGLALTKELVEMHHGQILVETAEGKGTVFRILLPAGRDHLTEKEIVETIPGQETKPDPWEIQEYQSSPPPTSRIPDHTKTDLALEENTNPLVLIVEDNSDLRIYIRGFLEPAYRIAEARDGQEGLETAIQIVPDLIISDVMMPVMDGYQFCREVKLDVRTSHIPLILLTARASLESKIEGLDTGADDFITKPFEQEELLARVQNLIRQRNRLREWYRKQLEPVKTIRFGIPGNIATEEKIISADERFVAKTIKTVQERMSDPEFSVEDFASEMAMSRMQLHRKLKALVGQNPSDFIRTFRLNRAAELLIQGKGNVSEIAWDVGFNNTTYFSSSFSKQFGMPPKEFIARNLKKED